MNRERKHPLVEGGQGRSDAEVEQCGLAAGVAMIAIVLMMVVLTVLL